MLLTMQSLAAAQGIEPLAVAPWRNLNDDATLRWLEHGAAETLAADLRKAGLTVVERTQIAEALATVRASASDDVAGAVAAGRIVGARAIVLGSFQRSGAQLRLTGRVVDVETGAVADAATATGALDDVFTLQDQIVAALTKRADKPATAKRAATIKRKPKATPAAKASEVRAYEKFSTSLTVTEDAERRALLEDALRLDPELVYARDALAALEARLRASSSAAAAAFGERERQLLAVVDDASGTGERRRAAARQLLDVLESGRRFNALRGAAERVLAAKLPTDIVDDIDERASAARVIALARLVKVDLALQAAEKHLAQFPAGARRGDVEGTLRELVDERRSLAERRREFDAELAEVASERGHDADWRRCIAAKWSKLADDMLARCEPFLRTHPKSEHVAAGRAYMAWAHAMRGEFAKARELASALEKDIPGAVDDTGLRKVMERWSAD